MRIEQPYASRDCGVPVTTQSDGLRALAISPESSTSSSMKAAARPLSRMRKDSPWSLALVILMPSFFSSFSLRKRRSAVVPAVTTAFLPARSGKSWMPLSLRVSSRVRTMKMVLENATCFWRSRLLVVEPHSMSTVPFCTSGIRFCEVTGTSFSCRLGTFSSCFTASKMRSAMSCE